MQQWVRGPERERKLSNQRVSRDHAKYRLNTVVPVTKPVAILDMGFHKASRFEQF